MTKTEDMVKATKPDEVPQGRHFVVIEYTEETGHDGWSEAEGGGTYRFTVANHYVTSDRKVWEARIAKLEESPSSYLQKKTPYVAFEVAALAKVERKITVSVG